MDLYTWNVNGIRANTKKGLWKWLSENKPDILALQEIKADDETMKIWWNNFKTENSNDTGVFNDQQTHWIQEYDCFWHSAQKKGYSGTAILYKKNKFKNSQKVIGINDPKFDFEGRTTILENSKFVLINSYYPQGGREGRIAYKLEFYQKIIDLTTRYQKQGRSVILCGDLNTTIADIDLAKPKENRRTTGCLPEEREVLNKLIDQNLVDCFRHFYPEKPDHYTYWDQITRARDRNVGWRIDYFLVDKNLIPNLKSCFQLDNVYGSDHCPVKIVLEF